MLTSPNRWIWKRIKINNNLSWTTVQSIPNSKFASLPQAINSLPTPASQKFSAASKKGVHFLYHSSSIYAAASHRHRSAFNSSSIPTDRAFSRCGIIPTRLPPLKCSSQMDHAGHDIQAECVCVNTIVCESVHEVIGRTPIVFVRRIEREKQQLGQLLGRQWQAYAAAEGLRGQVIRVGKHTRIFLGLTWGKLKENHNNFKRQC